MSAARARRLCGMNFKTTVRIQRAHMELVYPMMPRLQAYECALGEKPSAVRKRVETEHTAHVSAYAEIRY